MGSVVAHKCAQAAKYEQAFSSITLASRTRAKCDAIAQSVKKRLDVDLSTAQVDADNVPELCALLRDVKPDLVCNVALPYQDLHIMDACLECGVHYVDTANYEPLDTAKFEYKWQWAYNDASADAGLTALLGSGFDPRASPTSTPPGPSSTSWTKCTYWTLSTATPATTASPLPPISIRKSISAKSRPGAATGNAANGWKPTPCPGP